MKIIVSSLLSILLIFLAPFPLHAQMMWSYPTASPSVTLSSEDQAEIIAGQKLSQELQNKQISCAGLKNDDFEKIGEYVMEQQTSSPQRHAQLNQNIKNMMGEQGEEIMHITLGRRVTGCFTGTTGGGGNGMMGWGYGSMMGYAAGFGILVLLIQLAVLVDLILLGVWLWKQVRK